MYFYFVSLRQSAFHQPKLNHGIQDRLVFYLSLNDELPYLKEYYELRSGLYQRIILDGEDGSICPLLSVDVKHRAFPRAYNNLIDLLREIQKEFRPRLVIDLKEELEPHVAQLLTNHLDDLEICYQYDNNNGVLKFLKLGRPPAKERKSEKYWMTVQRHCDERGIQIKHPNLPCVRLGTSMRYIAVPLEYCTILGDQVSMLLK